MFIYLFTIFPIYTAELTQVMSIDVLPGGRYAKGNNWMPSSVLTADDARYQELTVARLKDEVAVGGNTIRVWGGGVSQTLSVSTDIYV